MATSLAKPKPAAKIILPISIDRWRTPISTLLRECVVHNPQYQFHSFSNPIYEEDAQLAVEFWGRSNIVRSRMWLAPLVRFDLCHIAMLSSRNLLAAKLTKWRSWGQAKLLYTINLELEVGHPEYWGLFLQALKQVDNFVAVSEAVAVAMKPYVGDRLLAVIPNGFDTDFFDPALVETAHLPECVQAQPERPFVLFLCTLEPRKRPEIIIELARQNPDLWFVCGGYIADEYGEEIKRQIEALPNTDWLGHVDRPMVRALFHTANVLAFPSEREGLPLTVAEALGMGLPTVAQPKSSLPEMITDGSNGRLIDETDLPAWGQAFRHYCALSLAERRANAVRIRAEAVNKYSWATIGAQYSKVYDQMLGTP